MDFQKDIAKKILSICLVLFAALPLSAQKDISCTVEILNNTEIQVLYTFEKRTDENNLFFFADKIPNYYIKKNDFVQIVDIISTTSNIKDTLSYNDSILLPLGSEILFYKVLLKPNSDHLLIAQSMIDTNNFSLLNWSNFLGNFSTSNQDSISLTVKERQKKSIYNYKNIYSKIIEQASCLKCIQKEISTEKNKINIFFNQKLIIDSASLFQYTKETLSAIENLKIPFYKPKNIIVIIDSLEFKTGAIAHPNTIVLYLNNLDKYFFQKTLIHEYIHWLVPNLDSWLNESVAEYLSLKLMLRAGLISDEVFLEKIGAKMKEANKYKGFGLLDLLGNQTNFSVTDNYKALYSKGAISAFFLDLVLQRSTARQVSLENYVFSKDPLKNLEYRLKVVENIIAFEKKYITDNEKIPYNKFLNELGILFERNKLVAIKQKQAIKLKTFQGNIYIQDNANINELIIGDRLIKLDGKKELNQIRHKLFSMSKKSSKFVLERDGKLRKIKISNEETFYIKKQFVLSFIENINDDQKQSWEDFKNK
ncbi:MAG: hypothetical protein ACPG4Y_03165 [Chitinophagales bacterium]